MAELTYAVVQDVPASWETYGRIADALGDEVPEGLLVHVAGRTDEGFRMIDVWESKDAWGRFRDGRLQPIVDRHVGGSPLHTTFRELAIEHLVRA